MIFLVFYCGILDNLIRNPAIFLLSMKYRPRAEEQDDHSRARLVDMIDLIPENWIV